MARTYLIVVGVLLFLLTGLGKAQIASSALGAGISFGVSSPIADISHARPEPFGRLFFRYHANPFLGLEAGGGLNILEAESDAKYFTSILNPIDLRVHIQAPLSEKVSPFGFLGFGMLWFNPEDRNSNPLPRNASGAYKRVTSFVPVGGGVQWIFAENTALEFHGTYHYAMSPNLDDIEMDKNDSYWSAGLSLYAYFGESNDDGDADGLVEREEAELGTDSRRADTDGDGVSDGAEVRRLRTNPLRDDSDGDGLKDGEENSVTRTNPTIADTDGDGLRDGDELSSSRTNPAIADTDGDGLSDGEEVDTHKTNPLEKDTDRGGVFDGDEVRRGSKPLDISDDQPPPPPPKRDTAAATEISKVAKGASISLPAVTFAEGSSKLTPEAMRMLDGLVRDLNDNPEIEILVEGHTNNVGARKMNVSLSANRAFAVKTYLESKGIEPSRIATKGYGPDRPIGDNATPEGRAKNRRIEMVRTK